MSNKLNGNHENEALELPPEQHQMVLDALKAKQNGEQSYTAEEVLERAQAKVKTWLPSQSA